MWQSVVLSLVTGSDEGTQRSQTVTRLNPRCVGRGGGGRAEARAAGEMGEEEESWKEAQYVHVAVRGGDGDGV